LEANRLQAVRPLPIVPEPPEYGLAEFEVSFGGGGNHIQFPNAHSYHEQHKQIWNRYAPRPNRLYRDHELRCLCAPMHELIHCVQALSASKSVHSWRAEYEASFGCLNLLALVTERVRQKLEAKNNKTPEADNKTPEASHVDLLPAIAALPFGLFEEIVLHNYETIYCHLHPSTSSPEVIQAYERWRDTYGIESPNEDAWTSAQENSQATRAMKDRIALEAYNGGVTLEETFRTFFEDHDDATQSRMNARYLVATPLHLWDNPPASATDGQPNAFYEKISPYI
jgi:hypothetical protein